MAEDVSNVQNYDDHKAGYDNFISGCIAITVGCFYILAALVICGFSTAHWGINLLIAFGGMFLGFAVLAVEAKAGSNYLTSLILWIVFALVAVWAVALVGWTLRQRMRQQFLAAFDTAANDRASGGHRFQHHVRHAFVTAWQNQ